MRRFRATKYLVTSRGEVYSEVVRRFLEPYTGGEYIQVNLGDDRFYLHRVVCEVYHGLPSDRVVNHKNGNRHDNRADNLEWCTQADNLRHAREVLGRTGRAKISEEDVVQVRVRYEAGETHKALANAFQVSLDIVRAITRGDSWRHVGGPTETRRRGAKNS